MATSSPGATPTVGIARDEDNYVLSKHLPVELGVNRVIIRAGTSAGRVRLTATAPGLKSASLSVTSHASPVKDGLSTVFPEDFQPVDLSRGPTPAGASFTPRLRTVAVAGMAAGSNAGEVAYSHDDDETTGWTSDGTPANAWIEYRFAQAESPTTLSMRLTGWRLRSYPIRVTLDGKVVYEGNTPRSLGYVTIPLTAGSGTRLRITQTGPSADRDAFGRIVEVANKENAAVGADKVPAGWRLSVVEADILAAPR
jgi:beta-galactosidase